MDFDTVWPRVVQLVGLGIAIYETVFEMADRPSLLLLAAGMMGLKPVLEAQRSRNDGKGGE